MSDCCISRSPLAKGREVPTARLPRRQIRPGTFLPDWSVVRSSEAHEALLAVMATGVLEAWGRDFLPTEDCVRTTLLRLYLERGHAPDIAALAARAGLSEPSVRVVLDHLQRRDLVVLAPGGWRIVGAYPFTDRETGHRVTVGDRTVTAMCAVDALGIGAMAGVDATVASRCAGCGAAIRITTSDQGRALGEVRPSSAVVWVGTRYEHGCAARSLCTVTEFFCSDDHLSTWRRSRPADEPGIRLSPAQALEVGRAIFGPSLADIPPHPVAAE